VANAGPDQTTCGASSITLAAGELDGFIKAYLMSEKESESS